MASVEKKEEEYDADIEFRYRERSKRGEKLPPLTSERTEFSFTQLTTGREVVEELYHSILEQDYVTEAPLDDLVLYQVVDGDQWEVEPSQVLFRRPEVQRAIERRTTMLFTIAKSPSSPSDLQRRQSRQQLRRASVEPTSSQPNQTPPTAATSYPSPSSPRSPEVNSPNPIIRDAALGRGLSFVGSPEAPSSRRGSAAGAPPVNQSDLQLAMQQTEGAIRRLKDARKSIDGRRHWVKRVPKPPSENGLLLLRQREDEEMGSFLSSLETEAAQDHVAAKVAAQQEAELSERITGMQHMIDANREQEGRRDKMARQVADRKMELKRMEASEKDLLQQLQVKHQGVRSASPAGRSQQFERPARPTQASSSSSSPPLRAGNVGPGPSSITSIWNGSPGPAVPAGSGASTSPRDDVAGSAESASVALARWNSAPGPGGDERSPHPHPTVRSPVDQEAQGQAESLARCSSFLSPTLQREVDQILKAPSYPSYSSTNRAAQFDDRVERREGGSIRALATDLSAFFDSDGSDLSTRRQLLLKVQNARRTLDSRSRSRDVEPPTYHAGGYADADGYRY